MNYCFGEAEDINQYRFFSEYFGSISENSYNYCFMICTPSFDLVAALSVK